MTYTSVFVYGCACVYTSHYMFLSEEFSFIVWCFFFSVQLQPSNRVEAWTRGVKFLLRQEGRPVTQLVGNASTVRIMTKDWETTDRATQWLRDTAGRLHQPFALYLGLNLPHAYKTDSLGPTGGGSTFLTSPYWLKKVRELSALSVGSALEDNVSVFWITFQLLLREKTNKPTLTPRFSMHTHTHTHTRTRTRIPTTPKVSLELISVPKWLPMSAMHPVDYYSTFTKNCSGEFTQEEIRNIRAFYYAMCAEADAMLGEHSNGTRWLNLLLIICF